MLLSHVVTVGAFASLIAGSPSDLARFTQPARPMQTPAHSAQTGLTQTNPESLASRFVVPAARYRMPIETNLQSEATTRLLLGHVVPAEFASANPGAYSNAIDLLRLNDAAVRPSSAVRTPKAAKHQSQNRPSQR